MDLDNLVRCEDCRFYNKQMKDCAAKNYSEITNEVSLINCEKYSPNINNIFNLFINNIISIFRRS